MIARSSKSALALWLSFGGLVLVGCGGGGGKATGTEGGPCYGNKTCNTGLTCYSDLCVKVTTGTAGTTGAGGRGGTTGAGGATSTAGTGGTTGTAGATGTAGTGGAAGTTGAAGAAGTTGAAGAAGTTGAVGAAGRGGTTGAAGAAGTTGAAGAGGRGGTTGTAGTTGATGAAGTTGAAGAAGTTGAAGAAGTTGAAGAAGTTGAGGAAGTTGGTGGAAGAVGPIAEIEPNNTTAQANASGIVVAGDSVIHGAVAVAGDVDVYRVSMTTAGVVRLETFAPTAGDCDGSRLLLRLLSSTGTMILSDNGSGIGQCSALVAYLDAGVYFVQVEQSNGNTTVASYELEVSFPADKGSETEPNDGVGTANTPLASTSNGYLLGSVSGVSDADYYTLTVPSFAHVRAEVIEGNAATATCDANQMDSELVLYDANGALLVRDDDSGRGFCSLIDGTGTAPKNPSAANTTATTQTFYLLARHSTLLGSGLDAFPYRVQVTIR